MKTKCIYIFDAFVRLINWTKECALNRIILIILCMLPTKYTYCAFSLWCKKLPRAPVLCSHYTSIIRFFRV
jgi:hypothetical protein